jgi:hypothetical protein
MVSGGFYYDPKLGANSGSIFALAIKRCFDVEGIPGMHP